MASCRSPETRYARSGEVAIAYQVHGGGPHDILFSGGTASNIETIWQLPEAVELSMLATSTGPVQSVRCASRVIDESRSLGLDVRTGVHTGELELADHDVAGLAVHLAARIMALAEGGEVLVSRTVRDLVIGSELRFSERGEHELKGHTGSLVALRAGPMTQVVPRSPCRPLAFVL